MIKILPPPRMTPALEPAETKPGAVRNTSGLTLVWEKWFQGISGALQIPEFANEQLVPATADGSNKIFRIPTAAPNPASGLQLFDGTAGTLIVPSAYFVT